MKSAARALLLAAGLALAACAGAPPPETETEAVERAERPEVEAEAEAEVESAGEVEAEAEAETEVESASEVESANEVAPEPASEPAPDTAPDTAPVPATEAASEPESLPDPVPPGEPLTHYMGREIATTMHWTGAEWLLRATREREEGTSRLLEALAPKPGQVLCDFGAGNGYLTLPLAELVGPKGKVYASEIQPEMLRMLRERAARKEIGNVEYVLGTVSDPKLPAATFDVVLMVDVYHEVGYPREILAGVRASLKPGGHLVLVEFRAEDPEVPIKPLHKMSKAQVRKELEANGFRLAWEFDELPWQHVLAFTPNGD